MELIQTYFRYIAMYPYKPQKADELELKKGILYTVTEKCQDGWFRGTSQVTHKSGVFPGNYVALPKNQSSPRSQPNVQGSPGWGRQPAGQPIPAKPGQNPVSDRPYMDLAKSVLAAAQAAVQNVTSASPGSTVGSKPGIVQSSEFLSMPWLRPSLIDLTSQI
jgi:Variant SH3 domain